MKGRISEEDYITLIAGKLCAPYNIVEQAVIIFGRNFQAIQRFTCGKRMCC